MATEHQPEHLNTYSMGANTDGNPEVVFSQPGTGEYIDARNAEPTSNDSDDRVLAKIRGEQIKYTNSTSAIGYVCMKSFSINDHLVEMWAPTNPLFPGIIRVNGVIVLQSVLFELRTDFPIQYDTNPSFNFNEFAFTDKRSVPYILDTTDMVASLTSDPQKYFANFDPKLYQVNLQSPLDMPVFVELINVGGGGGKPVGQYFYDIRYASVDGDRTAWSQSTPMIPVMQSLSSDSLQFPWSKTRGGPPNPTSKTGFAPKIRFRVTNIYNYDFIEVRCTEINAGAGIEYTPNGKIVAKIDISPGEISVREYIDPQGSNADIPLSAQEETQLLSEIETAGSIRYFDKRVVLGDIKLASKETNLTFKKLNNKEGFPVIDKIYKEGHCDPWNHTYRRKYMNGEKYSFAAVCYDGVGTTGFAKKSDQLDNYQFPNRRDPIIPETQNYSYFGTVRASTVNLYQVDNTHEVFDHYDATRKTGSCEFKNIIEKGRVIGLTGTRSVAKVTQDCDETNPEIENHGANVAAGSLVSTSYQPFHPVKQNDPDVTGHNYIVNQKIAKLPFGFANEDANVKVYRPLGFAPDYYAMGLMVAGVQNLPKWAKAFSIVRSAAAGRVVCQGLGYYKLTKGKFKLVSENALGGKEQNKISFYSPDIANGIVSSDTVNDILDNPQNYKMQFVSPLGFFSEWYSAEDKLSLAKPQRDRCIDMISYVRMLRDRKEDANEQINPFESSDMGTTGGDGYNYIRYDKFRNTSQDPAFFASSPDKGNKIIDIYGARRVSEGRGTFMEFQAPYNIYGKGSVGGSGNESFGDAGMKDWTEPIYIVNIIRTGATVKDDNIQLYKQTDHYQKIESIIGKSTGEQQQRFLLVDERWEDCIPAMSNLHYGASTDRFLYIRKPDGTEQKWINITYKTVAQKSYIISQINSNPNYPYKGVYEHNNIDGKNRFFEIVFTNNSMIPEDGSFIIVKYDDTAPIRVFGGDTFVGETIFAPIDSQASARDDAAETQFAFGIGLPYRDFKINPRYYTIRKAAAKNSIQDAVWFSMGFIRQLCVMFTVESKAACHLSHNAAYPNQAFPKINYVIRPNRWDVDKTYVENHVFSDYEDDYGLDEKSQWKWGGFRFLQQINPDYSTEHKNAYASKPEVGFEEKTEFPTMMIWSLPRPVNVQDAPGLKTFALNSKYILDDNQGNITYLWDATTEFGENIYAVAARGICLLVTKKSILSDQNAGEIAYMSADTFISGQKWLSREIGCPDKLFRGIAEGSASITQENGSEVKQQALFFPSKQSMYRLMGNTIMDIARMGYFTRVFKDGIGKILQGTETFVTAVYNIYKQQYWIYIKGNDVDELFVFSQRRNRWIGTNDFKFDSFSVRDNETFGHRDMQTFDLDKGYIINGQPISFEVTTAAAPEQMADKEFIRLRLNGIDGIKPTRVEFYKELNGAIQCALDPSIALQGALYMKNYRGYEAYVPRIDVSVDPKRQRFQQRLIIIKIIHNLASEFKVVDSSIQYKKLI